MEFFLVLLGLAIFFSPLIAVLTLRKKLRNLENRLSRLEKGAVEEEPLIPEVPAVPDTVEVPSVEPPSVTKRSHHFPPILKKLEKQFLDNWTGILGAVIVVLGAGFLSLYAALKMEEFARFLLLLLLAAIPAGFFYYLKDREAWKKQASWFRSMSGAIFLFACLGSGGIPGLQWIHNPFQSLGLLILGIGVNLGLSSLGGKQSFAFFHTLLSLMALAVIPPGTTSLFMAVLICFYAIVQTYKARWDLHLFLTITGFFSYHLYWMISLQKSGFTDLVRYQGASAVILIFLAAALIHYRKNYAAKGFELFPFLVHLANWFYFTAGMILYTGEYRWRTVPLIAGAVLALFLAQLAEKRKISWLKTSDYMIMQTLVVASLLTLQGWDMQAPMIWGLIFAETMLFARIMMQQENFLLYRIAVNLSYVSSLVLMGFSFSSYGREYTAVILSSCALILNLANHRSVYLKSDPCWLKGDTLPGLARLKREFSLGAFFSGLLGISAFTALERVDISSGAVYPLGAFLILLLLGAVRRMPTRGLTAGSGLFLVVYALAGWNKLLMFQSPLLHALTGLPLLIVSAAAVYSLKGHITAWLQLTFSLIFFSYAILDPVSPLLPGILWLLLSAGLALTRRIPAKVQAMGLVLLGAYLFRHFTVHINMNETWGMFPRKYLMDLLVLPVFVLWYRQKGKWFSLLLEITLLFVFIILLLELSLSWISLALECLALSALFIGHAVKGNSRLRLYSLFLNWLAIFLLTYGVIINGKDALFPLGGALFLLSGLAYLIFSYRLAALKEVRVPEVLVWMRGLASSLNGHLNALLLYPLILGCAFFIFEAAAPETRTLFWVLECFLLYGASLFLREEHFRYVSQGGLVLCVIRLIFVDMSGSTALVKGLVFLGVGIMMLGVNVLYNRYKERFQK